MENKQNMKKEKIKDWSYWAVITLLLIGIIANIAYTISYFTDSITARMTITFTKLDATLSYNSQTYTNDFTIDAGTLTTGSLLFSIPLSVSADEGSSAFIRVSAEYKPKASTSQEDISQAQAMCTVLNLNNSFTPYTNGTSYKWDQVGCYYYLTDLSDDLISVSFGSSYVFFGFGCSPVFPDTSAFDLENTDLTNVEFCVTAQAIQSSTTIEDDIENIMNYAFATTSNPSEYGYYIQYEENGGRNIYNTVVPKGSSITLPTVSNLSVYWRDASDDSSVGVSGDRVTFTSNKTLYAVYSLGKVTVYFEDPYVDSALLPQTAMVTPGGSVNVGATLTRAGYVYTQWTNGTIDLTVSANTITIPNSVPVNSILILHPKWSLVKYCPPVTKVAV